MVTSVFYLEMNFDRIDTKIERGGIMDKIEIVIVTGMSGAGKTTAMAAFENMAYCCIDNYPIALLGAFSEFLKDNTNYQRIAMAVSLADAPKAIRFLNNVDWLNVSVVFLDCDDNIILKDIKKQEEHILS